MKKAEYIEKYGEEAYRRKQEKDRAYRLANKERVKERYQAWLVANKDKVAEYKHQWYKDNIEHIREQRHNYYVTHRHHVSKAGEKLKLYCCEDVSLIENYELAKADNFVGWEVHHRLETHTSDGERRLVDLSVDELKALDMYYHRPAFELVYLRKSEHAALHMVGHEVSIETRAKISNSLYAKQRAV